MVFKESSCGAPLAALGPERTSTSVTLPNCFPDFLRDVARLCCPILHCFHRLVLRHPYSIRTLLWGALFLGYFHLRGIFQGRLLHSGLVLSLLPPLPSPEPVFVHFL